MTCELVSQKRCGFEGSTATQLMYFAAGDASVTLLHAAPDHHTGRGRGDQRPLHRVARRDAALLDQAQLFARDAQGVLGLLVGYAPSVQLGLRDALALHHPQGAVVLAQPVFGAGHAMRVHPR